RAIMLLPKSETLYHAKKLAHAMVLVLALHSPAQEHGMHAHEHKANTLVPPRPDRFLKTCQV
ncbi:MAG: hypothetical protein B6242_13310, partial [Anaerolineaceae bacterium 4572_78]